MNHRRIAALLRELADAFDEGEPAANDTATPKKRIRQAIPRGPINPPTELDRAAARAASRRLGDLVKVNR